MSSNKKYALVIGNHKYDDNKVKALPCCKKDGQEITKALQKIDFSVTDEYNMKNNKRVNEFLDKIHDNSIIFIYYSGHGCSKEGKCFMIPTDYNIKNTTFSGNEYYCVNWLVDYLESKFENSAIIIALDCCRVETAKNIGEQNTVDLPQDVILV